MYPDGASVCQVDVERTEWRLVPQTDDRPYIHGETYTFRQACLQVWCDVHRAREPNVTGRGRARVSSPRRLGIRLIPEAAG